MIAPGAVGQRERMARAVMAALLLVVVAVAIAAPWHSVLGVDNRTYAEMIDGVRRHGLPYTTNIDPLRFSEAGAPFNQFSHGKLWGAYPPLFAYVAAPALALGGLSFVYKLNVLLVGAIAIVTYLLGRRVSGEPLVGAAAAVVVVVGSPMWAASFETLSEPLVCLLTTLATLLTIRSLDEARPSGRRLAAAAGFGAGLSVAAHLVAFPMMAALVVGSGLVRGWRPDREMILRWALRLAAFGCVLAAMGAMNAYRFGTANPLSYGPCVWENCKVSGADDLSLTRMLRWAAPGLLWLVATAAAALSVRRSRRGLAIVLLVAVASLLPDWVVRDRLFRMASTLWGYAVDISPLNVRLAHVEFPWFFRAPDGLGNMHYEGTVLKGLAQCAPVLALAPLAGLGRSRNDASAVLCALPVAGLGGQLALNGCFPGAAALGWPYLFCRYVVPGVPMLAVLAITALRPLPWRWAYVSVAVAFAGAGLAYLLRADDDMAHVRRWLELRGTLAIAAAAMTTLLLARRKPAWGRVACVAACTAAGAGVAVSLGVDAHILMTNMNKREAHIERLAQVTPERFALVGWAPDLDPLLALRTSRDIEYLDLAESRNGWNNFREAMDVWADEGRPLFGAFPADGTFSWPYADWDVPAHLVDPALGFWRIDPPKRPAPPRR